MPRSVSRRSSKANEISISLEIAEQTRMSVSSKIAEIDISFALLLLLETDLGILDDTE